MLQQKHYSFIQYFCYLYCNSFDQITTFFPVLADLKLTQFFAIFLGLLVTFVITVLAAISVLLIYSLLMINVESRTFEIVSSQICKLFFFDTLFFKTTTFLFRVC